MRSPQDQFELTAKVKFREQSLSMTVRGGGGGGEEIWMGYIKCFSGFLLGYEIF